MTYQADGNDWLILSQDLPVLDGIGQTSGARAESYFSFAFLPFNAPPTAPAPIPAVETLTNFSKQRTIGWNAKVTETASSMYIEVNYATSDVTVQPLFESRGDNAFAGDGVLFATINEGLRDNSLTGGPFDYGIAAVDTTFDDEWWVRTATADPVLEGEININFSTAFFGADTGFSMAQGVETDGTTAMVNVTFSGVNSLPDGVLIDNASGNDDNYATAAPRSDGSGWDVTLFDDSTGLEGGAGNNVNYIFLPFDADNLIAGRVNEDGSLASSTETNEFSLIRDDTGEYLLTIPGKTSEDGMLLLTSTGEGDSVDNVLVYESAGSSFRILGLDMITVDEVNNEGKFVDLEDTSFMFAYIDFDAAPELSGGLDGDYDSDGDVDGSDFLAWQRGESPNGATVGDLAVWESSFGVAGLLLSASTAAQVPEPSTVLLVLSVGMVFLLLPARRTSLVFRS